MKITSLGDSWHRHKCAIFEAFSRLGIGHGCTTGSTVDGSHRKLGKGSVSAERSVVAETAQGRRDPANMRTVAERSVLLVHSTSVPSLGGDMARRHLAFAVTEPLRRTLPRADRMRIIPAARALAVRDDHPRRTNTTRPDSDCLLDLSRSTGNQA